MNQSQHESVSQPGTLTVIGALDTTQTMTYLRFEDGRVVEMPTDLFFSAPVAVDREAAINAAGDRTVPVIEEHLSVGKRTVETGRVRIQKTTEEYPELVDQVLTSTTFEVERVMLNQPVDAAPPVRTEGETMIYPVCEEQLVLSKRLVLKEEIRVTRRETERREAQTVTLRRERVSVERTATDPTVLPS